MIRFYVLAIDTAEPATLAWTPSKGAGHQVFTESEFRAMSPDQLADECVEILDKLNNRPSREPDRRGPSPPSGGKLFPDAGPLKPFGEDEDPDAWRRDVE